MRKTDVEDVAGLRVGAGANVSAGLVWRVSVWCGPESKNSGIFDVFSGIFVSM